jgi:hypothetical protein
MTRDFNCMLTRVGSYLLHIRPLEVCPLNYPEREQKPWGFFISTTFAALMAEARNA